MSELTYSQQYYQKNKERLLKYVNEKTMCECGTVIARINKAKHLQTTKHENRMRDKQYLKNKE
jgi:hypothetical protein